MKNTILLCSVLSVLTGCAHERTMYHPQSGTSGGILGEDTSGGYSESKVDDNIMVARFVGNAYTHPSFAFVFSQFRAVEICLGKGFKIAKIYGSDDKSSSQTVQRTNFTDYGTYGVGATSWNDTYHYPVADTYFSCANQVYMTKVKVKKISVDDMKPFVKDLMGAVQVIDYIEGSPNQDILQVGDFITKVNSTRVQNLNQYGDAINSAIDKNKIVLNIVREGKPMTVKVKAIDSTSLVEEENFKVVANACKQSEMESKQICSSVQRVPASRQKIGIFE